MITVLAGGVGAARFLQGLVKVVDPKDITVIVNVADDEEFYGLHVSPDIDTIIYTLSEVVDPVNGWGVAGDTTFCLQTLGRLGHETWFRLGDSDLGMHLHRTFRLQSGAPLSQVTAEVAERLGIRSRVLPVTNEPVRTRVRLRGMDVSMQEYFVKLRGEAEVRGVEYSGASVARPAPGVLEAIQQAKAIIVAPSNPFLSIGPVLAVPGVREALRGAPCRIGAVSPIVGGQAVKGPLDRIMRSLGMQSAAWEVASMYADFLDVFVLDHLDVAQEERLKTLGIQPVVTDTIMKDQTAKERLARATLRELKE